MIAQSRAIPCTPTIPVQRIFTPNRRISKSCPSAPSAHGTTNSTPSLRHVLCRTSIKPFPTPTYTRSRHIFIPRAAPSDSDTTTNDAPPSSQQQSDDDSSSNNTLLSVGLLGLWAGLVSYAFFLSPNQTPLRDQYFIMKVLNLVEDTVPINDLFYWIFFVMGIFPLIYTALLIPAGKSRNNIPVWPFTTLSYLFGAYALFPYMALWQPLKTPPQLPPSEEDLQGAGNLLAKGMESPVLALGLFGGALFCVYNIVTAAADGATLGEYIKLFQESRLVHATTLDFITLSSLAPFWMSNDADLRKWEPRNTFIPIFSVLPVVGPALYLVLRPKATLSSSSSSSS